LFGVSVFALERLVGFQGLRVVHVGAVAGLEGNLFNFYAMGGFLGYWLSPRVRTFVDSRAEHYDRDVYMDYSAVTEMLVRRPSQTFLDVLDRRDVDIFFGMGFPGWYAAQGAHCPRPRVSAERCRP